MYVLVVPEVFSADIIDPVIIVQIIMYFYCDVIPYDVDAWGDICRKIICTLIHILVHQH